MSERRIAAAVFLGAILLVCGRGAAAQTGSEPASGGIGTIAGQVIDATTGDPIIEAGVEVIGVKGQLRTDLDGRFAVKVPAGTYQVRFFAPLYQGARLEKVVVQPNKTATADVPLKPEGRAGVEVVEVVAQAAKAAEATQLIKRQKAPVVSDNIAAETIKKSPDADAAEIVQRVPAVTIKDDKFIFVRGLGERYSSAILEGSRLPSPDPERRVVPLDLFPAEFIDSISIVKTYTPDLPGDFSGGLADIQLLDFPSQLTYGFGLSTSGNSETTFQDFDTYKGSKWDYVGTGGHYRALPSIIPDDRINIAGASRPAGQLGAFGRAFKDIWETDSMTAPVDFKTSFQVGDRWGPFGARLAAIYETKYRTRRDEVDRQFIQTGTNENPQPELADDFRFDRSVFETRLGAVFTGAYELSPAHRLTMRALVDRNSEDETLVGTGTTEQTGGAATRSTVFTYKQDELDFGQLGGNHHFTLLDVDWRTALSRTTENIPDQRFTNATDTSGTGTFIFNGDAHGGERTFGSLTEYLTDSQVDFTVPFTTGLPFTDVWSGLPAKLTFGPAYLYRNRDSELRIFQFRAQTRNDTTPIDLSAPFNDIFNPSNVGGAPPFPVQFSEITNPQNDFKASHEIGAGYLMFELPLVRDRLRLIAGVRTEYSYIKLKIKDPNDNPRTIIKNDLDPLPGVNLVYSPRSDMNVRLAWSKTVSRPEFRELSPAVYPATRGLRGLVGNPDLEETGVDSYDARWEWFYTPSELVSVSGFYKTIDKPIETAVFISGSAPQDTFSQNEDGKLAGFEFEGRKNFGFLGHDLDRLSFLTNVTYVHSEVTAELAQLGTTRNRALQGQADYVVNAALEYAHPDWGTIRLLYNTVGPKIAAVQDVTGLPDFVTARRDQLDLVLLGKINPFGVPLNVKLSVENLLNDNYLTTVGGQVQEDYKTGITASLGIGYTY